MKGIIFKTIGALCCVAAIKEAVYFGDAAFNGKESTLAKDFDSFKESVREKRAAKKGKSADEPEVS